jgi:hypothetical protein
VSGKWFGPFTDLAGAVAAARNTQQDDVRACGVCIGSPGEAATAPEPPIQQPKPRANAIQLGPWEWDEREELMCALRLNWIPKGRLIFDPSFPMLLLRVVFTDLRLVIPMDGLRFISVKAKT